ncbi:protein MAIN-LIKE 2 [Rhodamnia argentea]|uniref:Protein MAIN-LIKE 2 n=1 Tax=Rhodamnia argentea TaxID=178133 RepID=A0ABM3H2X8_9MYRT|nr:protein MAIN-LIKE 2 [Rhodamnia argentea]
MVVPSMPLLADLISRASTTGLPRSLSEDGWDPRRNGDNGSRDSGPKLGQVWNRAGIFDIIMSTKYDVKRNQDVILGLSERWCTETNTFVFPWGEAAVTLEDVMVLSGYPVLGVPVTSHVIGLGWVKSVVEDLDRVRD